MEVLSADKTRPTLSLFFPFRCDNYEWMECLTRHFSTFPLPGLLCWPTKRGSRLIPYGPHFWRRGINLEPCLFVQQSITHEKPEGREEKATSTLVPLCSLFLLSFFRSVGRPQWDALIQCRTSLGACTHDVRTWRGGGSPKSRPKAQN